MSKHEKASRQKQGEVDQKHRVRQPESEPLLDRFHGWEQGTDSITETPFRPSMDQHAALLTAAHSDEGRANLVLHLQQTYGNQYVQRLLNSIAVQAKLTVSQPDDACEREADRVAQQVISMTTTPANPEHLQAQRQAEEEEEEVQTKSLLQRQAEEEEEEVQTKSLLQRQAEEEEEEELQAKPAEAIHYQATNIAQEVDTEMESEINAARGGGEPLPEEVRQPMEQAFGADFTGVRVHTDKEAGALSHSLQARAFTTGQDIFFGSGQYHPKSQEGQKLLAHELTHTIQQSGRGKGIQRWGALHKGTPHSEVTNKALDSLGPQLAYINWEVRKYLTEHSDDVDMRFGFLAGSWALGKAYETWGKIKQGARLVKKRLGQFGRALGRMARRGIGFAGEQLGITEEEQAKEEREEREKRQTGSHKGTLGRGWEWFKRGVRKAWRGLRRGIGALGEKRGFTKEKLKEEESKESERQKEEAREIARKAAEEYDGNRYYWRSSSEAPNHGEGGMYREDGTDKDKQRVDAYVTSAVKAWGANDRTQALQTLAFALHSAEDRGSHGDGKPGTGHDPRKSNPPPPGARNTYYMDYKAQKGKADDGYDCDRKDKNPVGFNDAVVYGREVLQAFITRIIEGDGTKKKEEEEKLGSYKGPAWYKRGARKVGTFFGKDIIRF
jgi:hypothetical protein